MKDYNNNAIAFLAFFFNFFYLPWSEGLQTLMNARANISKFLYVGVILIVTHGTFYLLQYEDPTKLKEAAAIVSDVKRNIFSKTTSLFKRLQSLSYMSHIYHRGVGAQLDNHLLKMQDKNLSEKDHREMLVSLLALFVRKCKEVIKSLIQADPVCEGQNMEKELNICFTSLSIDTCTEFVQAVVYQEQR